MDQLQGKMNLFRNLIVILLVLVLALAWTMIIPTIVNAQNFHVSAKPSQQNSCLQPPQDINLTSLSDAQLLSFGLPDHNVIKSNPSLWKSILTHSKHHTCGVGKSQVVAQYARSQVTSQGRINRQTSIGCNGPNKMCPNSNWAGNEAIGSRGSYRAVTMSFQIPSVSLGVVHTHSEVGIWAGLGGDTNAAHGPSIVLVQAGIIIDAPASILPNSTINAFWEYVGGGNNGNCTVIAQNLNLRKGAHTGDSITVFVHSNSSGYKNENAYFVINNTTMDYNSGSYIDKSGCLSDSASAEWIVERPSFQDSNGNLSQPALLEFSGFNGTNSTNHQIRLLNCEAADYNLNYQYVQNLSHLYNQIYSNSTNVTGLLASVGPINTTGDNSVFWHASS